MEFCSEQRYTIQRGQLYKPKKSVPHLLRKQPKEDVLRLYVGNLPYETTEEELQEMFTTHGQVESVTIIMDRYTGRSKGFGFVELPEAEEAQAAIEALNGTDFNGRPLTVNEAKPRQERFR